MREQFIRTEMLLGAEALERLQNARVALFGLGGVGGYTLEALTRSGGGQRDRDACRSRRRCGGVLQE